MSARRQQREYYRLRAWREAIEKAARMDGAAKLAEKTGLPVDTDGMRFHPPGSDGIPIVGPIT